MTDRFTLSDNFLEEYKDKTPPFRFGVLGELVYLRTYSRIKDNGENEVWWETVQRVVEGTYTLQKRWIDSHNLPWNPWKAQLSAQEMYDRIFHMKFLPPGRGLWAMGSSAVMDHGIYEALFNCAAISTRRLGEHGYDNTTPFGFLMDISMKGVGCGFDVKGEGNIEILSPADEESEEYVVPDTREGWVESTRKLLNCYFEGNPPMDFDYSEIRPAGEPLKTFGGIAPGPQPLIDLHESLVECLDGQIGNPISERVIVDIFNLIGKSVVSGGIRRTAELALGPPHSEEYLDLKNYKKNPERETYGWVSNNSVYAKLGMDYGPIVDRIVDNGEPGLFWKENVQKYSRMKEAPDHKDKAELVNPCGEIPLESGEKCNICETFPDHHESKEDYLRTLKFAYLYAKTVTLSTTAWPLTNQIMLRNRRIGVSVSGVAQFIERRGLEELREWLNGGYDEIQRLDEVYSDWLAIPRSIKTTTVKPSGNTSLVAGTTSGMHYPESRFYIRRVRLSKNSRLVPRLEELGYNVEPAFGSEDSTVVVDIPVDIGSGIRSVSDVSVWEQLSVAAFLQSEWSDNAVSCTITFDPDTKAPQLEAALNYFQYKLKSVSFLPRREEGAYKQMPYEEIDQEQYEKMVEQIEKGRIGRVGGEAANPDKFCDGKSCEVDWVEDG